MQPNKLNNWWEADKQHTHAQQYRSEQDLQALLPKSKSFWIGSTRLFQHAAIYTFLLFILSGC